MQSFCCNIAFNFQNVERMTIAKSFETFLENIKVSNYETIGNRYKEITKKLNKTFRDTESETDNCLQVGSYGRYTGISGISDLDMLYIMPASKWDKYKNSPQTLLADTRDALKERYPTTDIVYDRLVVDVNFNDFTFEVQPVFEESDDDGIIHYKYPDTKKGGYCITKPRLEQKAMTDFKNEHGTHHRLLCKMARAWKNNVGVGMGGLLIDTLAYNFLNDNSNLDWSTFSSFDTLSRDFLEYLKNQPKRDHYQALGSNQDVKVKHPFRNKAKESYKKAKEACNKLDESERNELWRDVFGNKFPKTQSTQNRAFSSCQDNEQFIENQYKVDIRYNLEINCRVEQNGFRPTLLRDFLKTKTWLPHERKLFFFIEKTDVPPGYSVKWKVRNVGEEAKRRHCLRGEIYGSNNGLYERKETSNFYGPHYVECYLIRNNIVVARDRIEVPIEK